MELRLEKLDEECVELRKKVFFNTALAVADNDTTYIIFQMNQQWFMFGKKFTILTMQRHALTAMPIVQSHAAA